MPEGATLGVGASRPVLQVGGMSETLLSLLILAVVFSIAISIALRIKFVGMPDGHADNKQDAIESWWAADPVSVFVREGESPTAVSDRVSEALEAASKSRSAVDGEPPHLHVAIAEAWSDIRANTQSRLEAVPRLALVLGSLSVFVGVFGAIAVSTEAVIRAIQGSDSGIEFGDLPGMVLDLSVAVLSGAFDVAGWFPYVDVVLALLLTLVIQLAVTLYAHWAVLSALLIGLAAAVWALDRQVPDSVDTRIYYHRFDLVLHTAGALLLIWLSGAVPAALGMVVGFPTAGSLVGGAAALIVTLLFCYVGAKRFRLRLLHAATINWRDGPDRLLSTYLVARWVGVSLGAVAVPLGLAYAAVAIFTGRLVEVATAVVDAPLPAQLALGIGAAGGVLIGSYEAYQRWPEIVAALQKALVSQGTRLLVFRKSVTAVGILLGGTIGWALLGIFGLLPAAVAGGLLVYGLHSMSIRARRNASFFEGVFTTPTSRTALVRCAVFDVDGQQQFVADIAGERLVHHDSDELSDDVAETAVAAVDPDESPPATESKHFGSHLFSSGFADPEQRRKKLNERVRKHTLDEPREEGRIPDEETWRDGLEERFPEDRVDMWVHRLKNRETLYPDGDGLLYKRENDPWIKRRSG